MKSTTEAASQSEQIMRLNDELRRNMQKGRVFMTANVMALAEDVRSAILIAVANFDRFSEDNDPYGEHDFGTFEISDARMFWKIDYYDMNYEFASPDPTDPTRTNRVLTIGLMSDY